jgi:PST family polysaccharide transporter
MIYDVPDLRNIGWWLAASLLIFAWGLQPKARLRRHLRVGSLALVDIAGVTAGLGAAFLASRYTSGVAILIAAQLTNVAVTALVAVTLAPVRLHRFRGQGNYRHALQVGWHMVGSDVLNSLRAQFPALVIGLFVVLHDVGLFNRAFQLLHLPLLVLSPALSNFLLPLLARSRAEPEQCRRHVRRTLRLFLAAAIPVSVWIALGPDDLLAFVLGEEWRPVMPILVALSPLFLVQIIAVVSLITLVGAERSRTARKFALWNLGLTAAAVLATAPFGVMVVPDLVESGRFILWLGVTAALAIGLCRLAPVDPVVAQIAGLAVAGAISGTVLFRTVRCGARPVPA